MWRFTFRAVSAVLMLVGLSCAQAPDFTAAQTEAVKFLSALVKIDTSNPPGNETRAAEYIKSVLAAEGITAQIFESAPGRGNIVVRLKGNGKKKPLLLMGHLDVVGVERDKWTMDPFAATIKDGYLYGRGSVDDKSMDAANLEVFLLLHRMKAPLDRDVILLAEAGEEGTSQFGIDFMVEKHWDEIACEYALNEGGARWEAPMRLNETTRRFFQQMAQISVPEKAKLYAHVEDPAVQRKLLETQPSYYSMLRTSLVPTIIKGGFRSNVIPAEAEVRFDVRALPDENMDQLKAQLAKLINDPAIPRQGSAVI